MKSLFCNAILMVILFLPLSGMGQNVLEEQLLGTWIFNYELSLELMDEKVKKVYESKDATRQDKIQQAYRDRKITFFADGIFLQELANGRKANGNWTLENDMIVITNSLHQKRSFNVKSINKDTLVLMPTSSDNEKVNMLFSQWYLLKSEDNIKSK